MAADLFISTNTADRESTEWLNETFHVGAKRGAADIHFFFENDQLVVKFGIGGRLSHYSSHDPGHFVKYVDDKIRARAQISSADRHSALDGRTYLNYPDRRLDLRLNILPSILGHKIVTRVVDSTSGVTSLDKIEMSPMVRREIDKVLRECSGLFLICGPTGSGKTTTLYAMLAKLHDGKTNIVTLEHPVEKIFPGITQVNISQHITYAAGLRAVLRQAPKVILVGEIRDVETAMIAIEAANTGHLVLASIHANNAAMVYSRLLDFGIDKQKIIDTVRAVISQRLVDRIDPNATNIQWREASEVEGEWLDAAGVAWEDLKFPVVPPSDDYCGRIPLIEMIRTDSFVAEAIRNNEGEAGILNAANRQPQFETMAQAGIRLATEGKVRLEDAQAVDREVPACPQGKRLGQVLIEFGHASEKDVFNAVVEQGIMRDRGMVRRLGQLLVEKQLCSATDVIKCIGYTEGAPELLNYFVFTGVLAIPKVNQLVDIWRRERQGHSLFDMVLEQNYLTEEQLYESSILAFNGRRKSAHTIQRGSAANESGKFVSAA